MRTVFELRLAILTNQRESAHWPRDNQTLSSPHHSNSQRFLPPLYCRVFYQRAAKFQRKGDRVAKLPETEP